jgi:hypothetical protein
MTGDLRFRLPFLRVLGICYPFFLVAVRHHCEERGGESVTDLNFQLVSRAPLRRFWCTRTITAFRSSADSPCPRLASSTRFLLPTKFGRPSLEANSDLFGFRGIPGFGPSSGFVSRPRNGCICVVLDARRFHKPRVRGYYAALCVLLQGVRACLVCLRVVGS